MWSWVDAMEPSVMQTQAAQKLSIIKYANINFHVFLPHAAGQNTANWSWKLFFSSRSHKYFHIYLSTSY